VCVIINTRRISRHLEGKYLKRAGELEFLTVEDFLIKLKKEIWWWRQ